VDRHEIISSMLENIPESYDKGVGSFFYDALMPVAIELELKYKEQDEILNSAFVLTAAGEDLDKKVYEQGLTRKAATYATGTVKVYGEVGTVIAVGNSFASDSVVFYASKSATVGAEGYADVEITCSYPGSVGNLPAGSIKNMPVTIPGITSVVQQQATTGGYDAETDDELKKRYFDKVTKPSTSGNKWDYYNWAMEVEGIGDAKVIPLHDGPGTVKVVVIDKNKAPVADELKDKVIANIEQRRPVGAWLRFPPHSLLQ